MKMKKINCILIIDDSPADNTFHKIIIAKADVCNTVKVVNDGLEGLEYLKKCGEEPQPSATYPVPDLILLDINMPRMNGFEFLEEYHKLEAELKSKIVIVMLTVSLNPDDRKKALENKEVTEFQNKPLTVEKMQEIIEKYFK